MPREYVIVTRRPPETADLRGAAADAGIDATIARVQDGALDIVRDAAGKPVLAVQYTQPVVVPDEVQRLAPTAAAAVPGAVFWTEGWSSTDIDDDLPDRIARALALRCDGVCVTEDGALA